MRFASVLGTGLACFVLAAVVACSGSDGSSQFGGDQGGDGNTNHGANGSTGPLPNLTGNGNNPMAACATSSAQAQQVPVYLVFMFDRSGSMGQNSKWTTCKAGLETFFADPKSAGLYASIQFFANLSDECNPAVYASPAVAMTALPSNTFASTIEQYSPNAGTPTLPAITGALQYAQMMEAQHAGAKVAVVLATDGIPNDCNSDVNNVAAEAAKYAKTIPTYVIGVGGELTNLDAIAAGGGTQKAFIVSVGNPQQTAVDFQNALNVIRGKSLACEYALPTPPPGQTLDINTVNVQFTSSGGQPQTLTYDKDCASPGGAGWHYDDANNPTKIEICKATCDQIQADTGGKIDIVTGCATQGGVTK